MNKAYFIPLSKDNSFSVIYGQRAFSLAKWSISSISNFFILFFSPFLSIRLFENRYFQSRLIILKELKRLNFDLYRPKVFTVEHNYTDNQFKIDELMKSNNYLRVFKNLTDFDAWYVCKDAL